MFGPMEAPSIPYIEADEDKPMPSFNHSRVAQNIGVLLHKYADRFDILQQLSLRLNNWATIPDVVAYPKGSQIVDWLADRDEVTEPPLLVVEILSPHQVLGNLVAKIRQYLENGVKSCWLVEPATGAVTVFSNSCKRGFIEDDIVQDDVLGISVPVREIFR
jgi:Uma2 family endonuclease